MKFLLGISAVLIMSLFSCKESHDDKNEGTTEASTAVVTVPANFNADSAYKWVAAQVAFGPRVPGTPSQTKCAAYLESELKRHCDTVIVQKATVRAGNGKMLPCNNVIGIFRPEATKRFLLLAHWDSRPWADQDTFNVNQPIDGADDGASGVGVLLEVASQLKSHPLPDNVGIDILFVDAEDYGKTEWGDDSYCLGTQYWAQHPHVPDYKADGGILLDMVGGKNAVFYKEGLSASFAADLQNKIWSAANTAGYSSYFPYTQVQNLAVTDDHKYVNEILHIPTVDIINLNPNGGDNIFPAHWHTHHDNMSIIDKATLKAVGQSVLQFLYQAAAESAI